MDCGLRPSSPSDSASRFQIIWHVPRTKESPPRPLPSGTLAPILRCNNHCLAIVVNLLDLRDLTHLKCTGDPILWGKIQLSCRSVAFTPVSGGNRRIAPIILIDPFRTITGFSYIESLILDRLHWSAMPQVASPLTKLPPTLQTLLVSIVSSAEFVSLSTLFDIDLATRFPRLKRLSLHLYHRIARKHMLAVSWLDSLPKTLRLLSAVCCLEHPTESLAYLNQSRSNSASTANCFILPMLEVLQLDSDLDEFSPIPELNPSIRVLRLVVKREFGTHELLPTVPTHESFGGGGLDDFRYETKVCVTTKQLHLLPRPTFRLALVAKADQNLHLPSCPPLEPTLRYLELNGIVLPTNEEDLPPTLESLSVSHFEESYLSKWLPKTSQLTRLSTSSGWISAERLAQALPPTLKELSCLLLSDDLHEHQTLFKALPKGFTKLEFLSVGFWEAGFALLPPSLLELHLYAATYFRSPDLNLDLVIRTTPALRVLIARAPPKTSAFRADTLKRLPRSLTYCQLPGIELASTPISEEEQGKMIQQVAAHLPPNCLCDTPFQVGRSQVLPSVVSKYIERTWPSA